MSYQFFESLNLDILPDSFALELTSVCNFSCPMCRQDKDKPKPKWAKPDLMTKLEPLIARPEFRKVLSVGLGENLLHPQAQQYFQWILDHDKFLVLVTNGTHLTAEMLRKFAGRKVAVRFSLDATDEATYKIMRHPDKWQLILDKIALVNQVRKAAGVATPSLGMSLALSALTEADFRKLPEFCVQHNIELVVVSYMVSYRDDMFKNSCWHDPQRTNDLIADVSRRMQAAGIQAVLPPLFGGKPDCRTLSHDLYWQRSDTPKLCEDLLMPWICADGTVAACCTSYINVGNLRTNSFEDVWYGPEYEKIVFGFKNGAPPKACRGCSAILPMDHQGAHFIPKDSAQQPEAVDQELAREIVLPSFNEMKNHFLAGNAHVRSGRFAEAVVEYQKIMVSHPYRYEAWNNAGAALLLAGAREAGLDCLSKAAQILPGHALIQENDRLARATITNAPMTFGL
jgi:MoaA/NifB/PqqE/SkfB family radical SAM enzyme